MLNTNTSVLARRVRIDSDYSTLPYEAGWASEAVFFTQVEGAHPRLVIETQVSPDGITWLPYGGSREIGEDEFAAVNPLTVFGSWVRLSVTGATPDRPARVLIHLALKG